MVNLELIKKEDEYPNLLNHFMEHIGEQNRNRNYVYKPTEDSLSLLCTGVKEEEYFCITQENCRILINECIHPVSEDDFLRLKREIHRGVQSGSSILNIRFQKGEPYHWVRAAYTSFKEGYVIVSISDLKSESESGKAYFYEKEFQDMLSEDIIAVSKINLTKNCVEYLWGANVDSEKLRQVETYDQMYWIGIKSIRGEEFKQRYEQIFKYGNLITAVNAGKTRFAMEYSYENNSGGILWAVASAAVSKDPVSGDYYYYSFIRDIDQKKQAEILLRKKAEKDFLTGLYNKETIERLIREEIDKQKNSKKKCAFMVMDIDNFKTINDTYGHPYGDYVLSQVGNILQGTFGTEILKGRFGGDEIIVYVADVENEEWLFEKLRQMRSVLQHTFFSHSGGVKITLSVGIVFEDSDKADFTDLFSQSDKALYEAKNTGKDKYTVFGAVQV